MPGQSSSGYNEDDLDEFNADAQPRATAEQPEAMPEEDADRASSQIDSPKFEVPKEDDPSAETPADDNAPAPAAPAPRPSLPNPGSPEVQNAFSALDNLQPPAPAMHQMGADPQTEAALESRGQQQDAANQRDYQQRQTGLFNYLHQSGVSVSTGPDGQPRVDTDEQGNPQWQPARSGPYQNNDGRWVTAQRDQGGAVQERDILDSGAYHLDRQNGDQWIPDGQGGKIVLGKDQPTLQKIAIGQQRAKFMQANAVDLNTLQQTAMAIKPLALQVKALEGSSPVVGGISLDKSVADLKKQASGDPTATETQMAQESLQKWTALHPEYTQAKAALDAATQDMNARRQAILDRKTAALTIGATPSASAIGSLSGSAYQDPASTNIPAGQTTSDHIQIQTAASAAQNGTSQLAALPGTIARLKSMGIKIPDAPTTPAQAAPPAPTKAPGGSDWEDFGQRIMATAGQDANEALQGIGKLTGFKGLENYALQGLDNSQAMVNPANDANTSSMIARVIGHGVAMIPGLIVGSAVAEALPEVAGVGIVAKLLQYGKMALSAAPIGVQMIPGAYAGAYNAKINAGGTDEEAKSAGAKSALINAAALSVGYPLGGAVAGRVEGAALSKLTANPEMITPFLKGVSAFVAHGASNMAVSAGVRAVAGEPIAPTAEGTMQDLGFAGIGATEAFRGQRTALKTGQPAQTFFTGKVGADIPQASRAAYIPIAKAVLDGTEPSIAGLTKMAADASLPMPQRQQASGAATLMRANAKDFLADQGQPSNAAATAPDVHQTAESQYRAALTSQDDLRGKYQTAEGDETTRAGIIDQANANTATMHGMIQARIDALPDDVRAKLGKAVDPSIDTGAVEAATNGEPEQSFAAQAIGADPAVRSAYVEPPREAMIGKIAAQTRDPDAAAKLVDRHVGMQAGQDLWKLASGQTIDEQHAKALADPQVGLAVTVQNPDGSATFKPTTDALGLMTPNQRAAIKARPNRFLIHGASVQDGTTQTPAAMFAQHVRSGTQQGLALFNRPSLISNRQHNVTVTSKGPGETAPTPKTVPVKAGSEVEAHAKATAAMQRAGHQVIDSGINPQVQPKGGITEPGRPVAKNDAVPFVAAKPAEFTPEGQEAIKPVLKEFGRNRKLFRALGIDAPAFSKFTDREASGMAVHGKTLQIDGDLLHGHFQTIAERGVAPEDFAAHALNEEIIHRAQILGAQNAGVDFNQFYSDLRNDPNLDPKLVQAAREAYNGFDNLAPSQQGAEIARMVVQRRWTGTITERIYQAIQHVVDYLKGLDVGRSELLDAAVKQAEDVLAKAREKAEKQPTGEANEPAESPVPQPAEAKPGESAPAEPEQTTASSSELLHEGAPTPDAGEANPPESEGGGIEDQPGDHGGNEEGIPKPDNSGWQPDTNGGSPAPVIGSEEEKVTAHDALRKEEDAHTEHFEPESALPVSVADKSVAEVLHTAKKVNVDAPKGATFIRVTDEKGRTAIEPLKGPHRISLGANPFRDAGPFTKVEAGTMGGKKGKEFIPMSGETKAESMLGAAKAGDGSEHFKNDMFAQAAWMSKQARAEGKKIADLSPEKQVDLAAKWRQLHPDAKAASEAYPIPSAYLAGDRFDAGLSGSEDARRSLAAHDERTGGKYGKNSIESFRASAEPLIRASEDAGRVFSPKLLDLAAASAGEHSVTFTPGRVLKFTHPDEAGAAITIAKDGNPQLFHGSLPEYMKRIEDNRRLADDDTRIEGIMRHEDGSISVVSSQKAVHGVRPNPDEVKSAANEAGYVPVETDDTLGKSGYEIYWNPSTGVALLDTTPDNFVKDDKGDLTAIDIHAFKPTGKALEWIKEHAKDAAFTEAAKNRRLEPALGAARPKVDNEALKDAPDRTKNLAKWFTKLSAKMANDEALTPGEHRMYREAEQALGQKYLLDAKTEAPAANVPARNKPAKRVQFETPMTGRTGAKITAYEWPWEMGERYSKREGGMVDARVSDWEKAVTNPHTGRDIVHQFEVTMPDGEKRVVSAEQAAKLLDVSQSGIRARGISEVKKEGARRDASERIEARNQADLDAPSYSTPQEAVNAVAKFGWKRSVHDLETYEATKAEDPYAADIRKKSAEGLTVRMIHRSDGTWTWAINSDSSTGRSEFKLGDLFGPNAKHFEPAQVKQPEVAELAQRRLTGAPISRQADIFTGRPEDEKGGQAMLFAARAKKEDLDNWPGAQVTREKDGSAKTFYHGTSKAAELSEDGKFDRNRQNPKALYGPGFYFTDDPRTAGGDGEGKDGYAGKGARPDTENSPGVVPAHLDVRNPFDIDKEFSTEDWKKVISEAAKADPRYDWDYIYEKLEQEEQYNNIDGSTVYQAVRKVNDEDGKMLGKAGANDLLEKLGYDGITHVGGRNTGNSPHRVVIAFHPEQVYGKFGGIERKAEDPALFAASAKPDYATEAMKTLRDGPAHKPVEPTPEERQRIKDAYAEVDRTGIYPGSGWSRHIADVMEKAGMPLNDASKGKVLWMAQHGEIDQLSHGDFSLSNDRQRAWSVKPEPGSGHDSRSLMVMPTGRDRMLGAAPAKGIIGAIQSLFAPATVGKEAESTALNIREHGAERANRAEQALAQLGDFEKTITKLSKPDQLKAYDDMENGRPQANAALDAIARPLRKLLNDKVQDVQALGRGALAKTVENYLPHLWKDPKAAKEFFGSYSKRPIEGNKNFLKQRTIPTLRDGMSWRVNDKDGAFVRSVPDEATAIAQANTIGGKVGKPLEPVSTNMVTMALLQAHQMDKFVMAHRILNEERQNGRAVFVPATRKAPEDWTKLEDPIGTIYGPNVTQGLGAQAKANLGAKQSFVEARTIRGHWYMPDESAKVLNNYLSPGLAGNPIYDVARAISNRMNQVQLGFSAFHASAESLNAIISQAGLGIKEALQGRIGSGIAKVISAPVAPFTKLAEGSKILREMQTPGSQGGDFAKIADAVMAGGGRGSTDASYQTGDMKAFFDALHKGGNKVDLLRAPFAAVEALSHPLMNKIIPRLKLGIFADMARGEMDRLGPNASREQIRKAMSGAWDSIDNRFGTLVQDNLFWHKSLRDLAQVATRSVGWNLGTIRELGGGVLDTARIAQRIKAGGPAITHRMTYTATLPIGIGLLGALYQYLHSGLRPGQQEDGSDGTFADSLRDYFNPRTGASMPDGTPERVRLPSYMKDVASYSTHPISTIANKAGPLLSSIEQMLGNKDFYGTEIVHGSDPIIKKIGQEGRFVASQFVPFSVSSNQQRQVKTLGSSVESKLGITPAPAEAIRTPAMQLLHDSQQVTFTPTREQREMSDKKNALLNNLRKPPEGKSGNQLVQEALADGLSHEKALEAMKEARQPAKLAAFHHAPIEAAEAAYKVATPEEKRLWAPALMSKRATEMKKGGLIATQ